MEEAYGRYIMISCVTLLSSTFRIPRPLLREHDGGHTNICVMPLCFTPATYLISIVTVVDKFVTCCATSCYSRPHCVHLAFLPSVASNSTVPHAAAESRSRLTHPLGSPIPSDLRLSMRDPYRSISQAQAQRQSSSLSVLAHTAPSPRATLIVDALRFAHGGRPNNFTPPADLVLFFCAQARRSRSLDIEPLYVTRIAPFRPVRSLRLGLWARSIRPDDGPALLLIPRPAN
ncbi:hypothetical protein BC628DRAFT_399725 [Trametes gibbosa]|nr:hypothetical protein BC628DRAFT_399725 [Trametes gibbosa]